MSNQAKLEDSQMLADFTEEILKAGQILAHPPEEDEVCITGMAGVFPGSRDIYHYAENLYNKVDLVTDDNRRWSINHPEIPIRSGTLFDVQRFDAGYFGVHYRQAHAMDPMTRMLLERTTEAIMDAGMHPKELEGTKTGVFVGLCFVESENTWFLEKLSAQYFAITGLERSMLAQRISYFLKLKGMSHTLDTACSSSLYAIEHAYRAIRNGEIEQAFVAGANLCLHPFTTLQFARLGALSKSGKCNVFDADGDGYVRSEAVGTLFLQKRKDSKRIYAHLLHAQTNCDGYKEQGLTFPSSYSQKKLLTEFYLECGVDPTSLSYLEAHGTGTKVGDPEEVDAIDAIFCKKRNCPLMVGSVKSNIGHSEPASGVCSIVKVLIAMENGFIPPNINFKRIREGLEAIEQGRLKVVTEKTPFEDDRGLIAVNSFGFGGSNSHILLHWNPKTINSTPEDNMPRLVCISGRTEEAVTSIQNDLKTRPLNVEYIRLYHNVFSKDFDGHYYRGYSILTKSGEILRSTKKFMGTRRSLYFVFSDFGEYWSTLTNQLNCLPQFAASIQKVHNIFNKKGMNLNKIIKNGSNESKMNVFEQILGNFALQIGLCDILKMVDLQPDGFFGYGISELVCGYFDGTVTLEEAALSAFQIAKTITDAGKEFNGENPFQQLKPQILKSVQQIITAPKNRSKRWISTNASQFASADHFVNVLNMLFSIEQITNGLKKNSVFLHLSSNDSKLHMKNTPKNEFISFDKSSDGYMQLLNILGRLYQLGLNSKLEKLYPKVSFPVSRGTPMISPLIKWDHSKEYYVTRYSRGTAVEGGEKNFRFNLRSERWNFFVGHVIDGRNLFPATGYLYYVWEMFASELNVLTSDMKIVFENCKFIRATPLTSDQFIDMVVMVQRSNGNFEVTEGGELVASGRVFVLNDISNEQLSLPSLPKIVNDEDAYSIPLQSKDIYKEMRLRGYNYTGSFQRLKECNVQGTKALLSWDDNWITFMDNMLQVKILQMDTRFLYVPTGIRRMSIDAKAHIEYVQSFGENPNIPVDVYKDADIIKSGFIEIRGLSAMSIPRRKIRAEPVLEKYEFTPNFVNLDTSTSVRVNVQMMLENLPGLKIKIVELIDEATNPKSELLSPIVFDALGDLPLIRPEILVLSKESIDTINGITVENQKLVSQTDCNLVIATNLLQRPTVLIQAFGALKTGAFIMSREPLNTKLPTSNDYNILTVHQTPSEQLVLFCKKISIKPPTVVDVTNGDKKFDWIKELTNIRQESPENIIVVAQNDPLNGILGFVNCLRREANGSNVKGVFILDPSAPPFDPNHSFYEEQMKKNYALNVYKDGQWGTYRHLLIGHTPDIESEHCFLNTLIRGDLSSLRWIAGPLTSKSKTKLEKSLVYVYYSALNFRDVMTATGRINADVLTQDRTMQECVQGFEFSGKDGNGRRVFGMTITLAMATMIEADPFLIWDVPAKWTLEEAASIPCVYGTVIYCLFVTTQIKAGDKILIHAGSGGVGQAAIQIALYHGCEVFTTVGTKEKREYLKKRFPKLKDCNIGNSRDISFEQMIYQQTKGYGVDFVLNSLSEEKLEASVRCLAKNGNFIEIGKFDLASNNKLKLKFLEKGANFHGVMLDNLFLSHPTKVIVYNLLGKFLTSEAIRPIDRHVFTEDQAEDAFRLMAQGKHIGKVLIKLRDEEVDRNCKPSTKIMKCVPMYRCDPEKVTVIVGGLGGIALELADWLVLRGCRNLVLNSRNGIKNGYQSYRIRIWRSYGTKVHISTDNVSQSQGCERLFQEAVQLGTIEAIFNLAVVLQDAMFENQTAQTFETSLVPKAQATVMLDEASRRLCPNLRKFVTFSSVSCGRGNAGQTNYGMSNSIMERICEKRRSDGLSGLAIQWGAIGEVGLVADMQETDTEIEIGGTLQQRVSSCLQVLDSLLNQDHPVVGSMVVAEKKAGAGGASTITEAVAIILGIHDMKTVSTHATLAELGMDSMSGVEIKQTLEREFDVFLSPQEMRSMTFARLFEIQEEKAEGDTGPKKDRPVSGFEMVLKIFPKEDIAKQSLVQMNTKIMPPNTSPHVFCFPGMEGICTVFDPLMENLYVNATCVQFPYDRNENSIESLSGYLFSLIQDKFPKDQPFCIIGYSWGVIVSLEVVSLLEELGYTGTLICIDGAPYMLRNVLKASLNVGSQSHFETGFICQFLAFKVPFERIMKSKDQLLRCTSFEERLKMCEEIVPNDTDYTTLFWKQFCTSTFSRLKFLSDYHPTYPKLKSKLVLYKPQSSSLDNLAVDYRLQELCEQPIEIQTFEGNHSTILRNTEMAEAINRLLGVMPENPETELQSESVCSKEESSKAKST